MTLPENNQTTYTQKLTQKYERSQLRPTGEAKAIHQLESESTTSADIHNAEEHIPNLITSSSADVDEDHGSLHACQDLGSSLAPELVLYAPLLREELQEEEYVTHPNHVPHSPACSIQCMHAPQDECQLPHTADTYSPTEWSAGSFSWRFCVRARGFCTQPGE